MIIVGLSNPYSDCGPLDPRPGSAGARLWRMSGLPLEAYLKIKRTNIDRRFTTRGHADAVLLGRAVWRAFFDRDVAPFDSETRGETRFHYVPHPSGRNRCYNSVRSRARVRALFAELASRPTKTTDHRKRADSTETSVTGKRAV